MLKAALEHHKPELQSEKTCSDTAALGQNKIRMDALGIDGLRKHRNLKLPRRVEALPLAFKFKS